MQFRKFGQSGWSVSALGFGCMRLPTGEGLGNMLSGEVVEKEAIEMIRYAIDRGVNYVDTAYLYHLGRSEVVVGRALSDGYRDRVRLATKLPVWMVREAADFDRFLSEQLERLSCERVDYYLLHGLGRKSWKTVLELDLLSKAEAAVRSGRVARIGFSFHDDYDCFKEIVDAYEGWSMCLLQYNYMDTENQAGTRGVRYAASRGLAVAVMEPLLGGSLAGPPDDVRKIFDDFEVQRSPAEWALHWLWSQPEVSVVLSGMSSMAQVRENIESADASRMGLLGAAELGLFERVRKKFAERAVIPCTRCGYCMPCPNRVDIPANIELYNEGVMYEEWNAPRFKYLRMGAAGRAEACDGCGECEEKCPQGIPVAQWMPRIHAMLKGT